jgi:hypothetical protein
MWKFGAKSKQEDREVGSTGAPLEESNVKKFDRSSGIWEGKWVWEMR